MYCEECGCKLDDDASFCPECGAKTELVEEKEEKEEGDAGSKQRINISLIVGIAIAVAFIAFIASLYITAPSAPSTNRETTQTQETEAEDTTQNQAEEQKTQSKYILENSATKELTNADIAGLTDDEICKAQNEIWARHGRKFKNDWLQEYFNGQSWYSGTIEADEFLSKYSPSDVENKNAQFLNSVLSSKGYDLNKAHPNGSQTSTSSATGDVVTKTQELKNAGYNMVLQGEVKLHSDSSADGRTLITPYIRLNEYAELSGYQASDRKVRETRTICPNSSYDGEFRNEDQILAYFSNLNGHQVLIGFNNDSQNVQFAAGVSCNYGLHSKEACDLMNFGWVTGVRNFTVKDLG